MDNSCRFCNFELGQFISFPRYQLGIAIRETKSQACVHLKNLEGLLSIGISIIFSSFSTFDILSTLLVNNIIKSCLSTRIRFDQKCFGNFPSDALHKLLCEYRKFESWLNRFHLSFSSRRRVFYRHMTQQHQASNGVFEFQSIHVCEFVMNFSKRESLLHSSCNRLCSLHMTAVCWCRIFMTIPVVG